MKSVKGQGGLDLMISYGWVIIVGILAAVLFYGMGFLNPVSCDNTRVGFSQVMPQDWEIYPGENKITVHVENWAGEAAEITEVNATLGDVSCRGSPMAVALDPGEAATLSVDCLGGAKMADRYYPGSCYTAHVSISYEYPYGESYKSAGTLKGRAE